jgi:hypothetical protein
VLVSGMLIVIEFSFQQLHVYTGKKKVNFWRFLHFYSVGSNMQFALLPINRLNQNKPAIFSYLWCLVAFKVPFSSIYMQANLIIYFGCHKILTLGHFYAGETQKMCF